MAFVFDDAVIRDIIQCSSRILKLFRAEMAIPLRQGNCTVSHNRLNGEQGDTGLNKPACTGMTA